MTDEDRPLSHPDLTPEEARARAIAEVLAEQSARKEARRQPEPEPTTTWGRVGALVVLSLVALYVGIASPAWLVPSSSVPVSEAREEAGLRMAVYLQAQQVELFRRERGRLPDVLREVGEPLPGLRYERIDARTFRIRAFGERASVLYVSTDPLADFAESVDLALGVTP